MLQGNTPATGLRFQPRGQHTQLASIDRLGNVKAARPLLLSKLMAVLLLSLPLPAGAQTSNAPCKTAELPPFVNGLTQVATWVAEPAVGIDRLVENYGPQLTAYLSPAPWPDIHERARMAKVPVVMYHDILPEKEVFFDVTPAEFEEHLRLIQENGLTPISLDQLTTHLRTGLPLPEKPILLSFDDGYGGHYEYVYPLLKKYGYPGVFSIYTSKIGDNQGRSHVNWEQLRQMAADPQVTIAAHSISHPPDLRALPDDQLQQEIGESKQLLESELGIAIRYFTYPTGLYDERVSRLVREAGYLAALTMNDLDERFAGESENLLAIGRFGQSRLEDVIAQAWGGPELPKWSSGFDFTSPIERTETTIDNTPFILISGGKPITIHADSRYQVPEIVEGTEAVAAVDGGFFSLKFLDSNEMIGPVLSQNTGNFLPGTLGENRILIGRPLVMIIHQAVKFIPLDQQKNST